MNIPRITYMLNEKLFGRNTLKRFRELKKIQRYSAKALKELQFERLKALLAHAYDYVDYYRDSFKKTGFNPKAMNSFEEVSKLPLLSKANTRNNLDKFISKDKKRKLTRYATSGSTGEPLIFYLSNERIASNKAAYLLLYSWWGLDIGDREVVLWGSQRDAGFYNIIKRVRDNLLHTRLLPAFHMSESTMHKYVNFIKRYKPEDVFGYAHSIYLLARFAKNRKLRLNNLGVKVVFTTAELLHDYQRQAIEDIFDCPVSNCYGGRESGLIAFECPKGKMHLNPNVYTEVINGEIVITDLDSLGFPFIRYRTGDRGVLSDESGCACGSNFPILKEISGRDTDYIVNAKGEFIHPLALEYIFREIGGMDYFKITQKSENKLVIDMVLSYRLDATGYKLQAEQEEDIRNRINQVMSSQVEVVFRYVKQNEIAKEDKYKFVVSEIIRKYIK